MAVAAGPDWRVLFLTTVLFSTIFVRDDPQTRQAALDNSVFGELPYGKSFSCATCHCRPKKLQVILVAFWPKHGLRSDLSLSLSLSIYIYIYIYIYVTLYAYA